MIASLRRLLLEILRYLVPARGENVFTVENGTPIEFVDGEAHQLERVPGGYVFVDGSSVGDIGPVVLRDREVLARDGFVMLILRRDSEGRLRQNPEIITRGFVYMKESEELLKSMSETLAAQMKDYDASTSDTAFKEKASELLNKLINTETKRRPMVVSIVA